MSPVAQSEMLDELAVDVMDLQSQMAEEGNKNKHKTMIRKMIDRNCTANKYQPIPEFEKDLDWFNVSKALTFKEHLTGYVTIIDFFTYCCINCLHILPQLHRLEKKYPTSDGLVIVGCHSAKFTNEKSSDNVKSAIQRHDITHPVVNDLNNGMWTKLNIQCWPTMLFLSPTGAPFYLVMGEGHYDEIELVVGTALEYYKDQRLLSPRVLPIKLAATPSNPFELRFPGKIQCSNYDASDNAEPLYALSDSLNHRIIIFNANGNVLHQIGTCGVAGSEDGSFQEAKFNNPQVRPCPLRSLH
jgi:thiol-disulfide isomerase/thioredoxin